MAVRSYYCAVCGIKLTPEQAQFGRPSADSLTSYCPTCAEEKGIEVLRDAPPLPSTSSGRFRPLADPSGAQRAASTATPRSLVPVAAPALPPRVVVVTRPARGPSWAPVGVAIAVVGAMLVTALLIRTSAERPEPRAEAASAPPPVSSPGLPAFAAGPDRAAAPALTAAALAASSRPPRVPQVAEPPRPRSDVQTALGAASPAAAPARPPPAPVEPPAPERLPELPPAPVPAPPVAKRVLPPPAPPPVAGALVGNKKTKKVHLATCQWATKMSPGNRVPIASRDDAKRLGYELCKECLR